MINFRDNFILVHTLVFQYKDLLLSEKSRCVSWSIKNWIFLTYDVLIFSTFNDDEEYQEKHRGPIRENAVLTLDPKTGDIINGWGNQTFYLPHGLHVDPFGNIWLTDIALHQVFKVYRKTYIKIL